MAILGEDVVDPWSRAIILSDPRETAPLRRIEGFAAIGERDLSAFLEVARLLNEDAFLAERDVAFGRAASRDAMYTVTQDILAARACCALAQREVSPS